MGRKAFGLLMMVLLGGLITHSAMAADLVISFAGGAAGDAVKECFIKPFEQATGLKVGFEATHEFSKLKAMVQSKTVTWDLAEGPSIDFVILWAEEGLLEPLDYTIIDKQGLFPETLSKHGIGKAFYTTVLGYNSARYPRGSHPTSWKDFWDVKKFPGGRSLRNAPDNNLEFALMADGVPPDKLYPLDIDRAFRSLDRIKPHVKVWWSAGAQPAQLLTDQEVDMASGWNGRILYVQKQGAKVGLEWNQGVLMFSSWVVPKGAPHAQNAMKFLNFSHQPKLQACYAQAVGYPGVSVKAVDYLDSKFASDLPTYPENYKKQVVMNYEWWRQNRKKAEDLWNAWIIK